MSSLKYLKYPAFLVPAFAMGISMASADEHECDCPCDKETASVSAKHDGAKHDGAKHDGAMHDGTKHDGDRSVAGEMHKDSADDKAIFTSNKSDKPNASSASKPSDNAAKRLANANDNNKHYLAVTPANNYFSTSIIGQEVINNHNDEIIGTVEEILIDRDGQVGAVILSIGGLMGLGEKDVAIAWDQIDRTMGDDNEVKLSVDFSEASLADAPTFDRK